MPFEAKLVYNEQLLRQVVFGFWRRSIGIGPLIAFAIAILCIVLLIVQGDASWIVGALGAVLAMGAAFAAAVYVVHYRNTMRKFREMGEPEATFRAEDSTFTLSSGLGTSTLKWSSIKEVWRFEEFWLLLFSRAQFVTLPTANLSAEMQTFVLRQVQATGGKLR